MRRARAVRVIGPLQWIVYPALVAMALSVLLATPIRLFGLSLPEPVLPLVLAFAWPLIRPSVLAPAVLFGLGVFLDLLWGGPLGLWPLSLMSVYGLVLLARSLLAGQETRLLFFWFACAVVLAFLLAYLVVRMDVGAGPALWPVLMQIVPTLLLFPAADWLIQRFDDADVRFR